MDSMTEDNEFAFPLHRTRDIFGAPLVPGVNVDAINVEAGLRLAVRFGYDDPRGLMVITYALQRHARGEEDGAQRTALGGGVDLTSWYAILAAARASAVSS